MADRSKIEWTDATWSPIRARWFAPTNDGGGKERIGWHCEHVSEGCRNCYSEAINKRLGTGLDFKPGNLYREERKGYSNGEAKLFLDEKMLLQPLRWRRPRMIFVCSMTDLFADFVTDDMIDRVFGIMALSPRHIYQVLTKRPARMRAYVATWFERLATIDPLFSHPAGEARFSKLVDWSVLPAVLPNVWLGTSCEDQATADARIPELLATQAAVRFVSAEPLLGPIDFNRLSVRNVDGRKTFDDQLDALSGETVSKLTGCLVNIELPSLDWVIVGSETGSRARDCDIAWVRSIRNQCASASVPFFFKQHALRGRKIPTPELDGRKWVELPLCTSAN